MPTTADPFDRRNVFAIATRHVIPRFGKWFDFNDSRTLTAISLMDLREPLVGDWRFI